MNKHILTVLEKRKINVNSLDKIKKDKLDWVELYDIAKEISMDLMYKKKYKNVCILYDPDVDGLYSGYILEDYLIRLKLPRENIFRFMNKDKAHGYTKELVDFVKENNIDLLFVVDAGSSDTLNFYNALPDTRIVILDHHEYETHELPENNLISKLNVKDKEHLPELSGCGMVYRFIEAMNSFFELHIKMYEIFVGITVISDSCSMTDNENRYYVNELYKNNDYNEFLKTFKELGFYGSNMSLFAFKINPFLNALIRIGKGDTAMKIVNNMDNLAIKDFIIKNEAKVKEIQAQEVDKIIDMSQMVDGEGFVILLRIPQDEMSTLNGLVASRLMGKMNKSALVLALREDKEGNKQWKGSFRGFDYTNLVLEPHKLECHGHDKACGVFVYPKDLRAFTENFEYIPEFTELYDIEMSMEEFTKPENMKAIAEFNEYASGNLKNIVVKITDDFNSSNASKQARGTSGKFNIISYKGQEIVDFSPDPIENINELFLTVNLSSYNPYQIVRQS